MTPIKPAVLLATSSLALGLAGCKPDNRPLLSRMSGAPSADYAALPQPGPAYDPAVYGAPASDAPIYSSPAYGSQRYRASYLPPQRAYPYAERAYRLDRAFYDLPPDYGFAYGDEQPWAWQAADQSLMFAEPYGDAYRFYYYQPGAAYPYFVRDPSYGYAYGDNGTLLALFDAAGALLGGDAYDRYYPSARQYWSRGYDLHRVYGAAPRYTVDPGAWSRRAPAIQRLQQPWINGPERQPGWRQWRATAEPQVLQRDDAGRPARVAVDQGRGDNDRRHGWNGRDVQPGVAAQAPQGFEPPGRMARPDRGARFAREASPAFAPSAPAHGRDASGRVTDHEGEALALRDRAFDRVVRAAPPPAIQHGGEGHGWHGGGDHGPHAQPQAQAQPQPAQGGQQHGQGGGQGKPQDQQGGDHGRRHGG